MKTVYYTAVSLDGFIADRDHSLEWLLSLGEAGNSYEQFIADVGAIAMGSTTYEWLLANFVRPGTDQFQPWPYEQPTWIFSSRVLPEIPGADLRFVGGNVRAVHDRMVEAAAGRNIWLVGGGDLVGQFYDQGLLDLMIVQVASVTLAGGAPLLPRRIVSPMLRLISAQAFNESFAELRYEVRRTEE